jgi:hypothetical protein
MSESTEMPARMKSELVQLIVRGCQNRLGCKGVTARDVLRVPLSSEARNWDADIPSLPKIAMREAREVIDQLLGTFILKK